jgi:hypothetical protein
MLMMMVLAFLMPLIEAAIACILVAGFVVLFYQNFPIAFYSIIALMMLTFVISYYKTIDFYIAIRNAGLAVWAVFIMGLWAFFGFGIAWFAWFFARVAITMIAAAVLSIAGYDPHALDEYLWGMRLGDE